MKKAIHVVPARYIRIVRLHAISEFRYMRSKLHLTVEDAEVQKSSNFFNRSAAFYFQQEQSVLRASRATFGFFHHNGTSKFMAKNFPFFPYFWYEVFLKRKQQQQ